MKKIFLTLSVLTLLISPMIAGANMGGYNMGFGSGMMNMMGFGGGFGSFNIFSWLSSVVWLVVGVLAAIWLYKQISK